MNKKIIVITAVVFILILFVSCKYPHEGIAPPALEERLGRYDGKGHDNKVSLSVELLENNEVMLQLGKPKKLNDTKTGGKGIISITNTSINNNILYLTNLKMTMTNYKTSSDTWTENINLKVTFDNVDVYTATSEGTTKNDTENKDIDLNFKLTRNK